MFISMFIAQQYICFWCFESLMHCLFLASHHIFFLLPIFYLLLLFFTIIQLSFCTVTVLGIFIVYAKSLNIVLIFDIFIILFNFRYMVLKCIKVSSGDWFPIHKNIYLAVKGVRISGSYFGAG